MLGLHVLIEGAGSWLLRCVGQVVQVRLPGVSLVGVELRVEGELDGADVERADEGLEEEALAPASEQVHALVVLEHVLVAVHVGGLHGVQVARDVAAVLGVAEGGRVEPVVVRGRQVDHHVEELVAGGEHLLHEGGDRLLLVVAHAQHELVQAVGAALHTVDGRIGGADLAAGEHSPVAWTRDRGLVLGAFDDARSFLELAGEELVEGLVEAQVGVLHLREVDPVDLAKGAVDGGPQERGDLDRADHARQTGDVSRKCDLYIDTHD